MLGGLVELGGPFLVGFGALVAEHLGELRPVGEIGLDLGAGERALDGVELTLGLGVESLVVAIALTQSHRMPSSAWPGSGAAGSRRWIR